MTVESIGKQSRPKRLNKREHEILRLMADECSPNEIAVELIIAVETVDWYRRQILKKLEAKDQQQALVIAQEMGLVEVPISHTEDETLPARPDEFVSPTIEVSAFFDNLPEEETVDDVPIAAIAVEQTVPEAIIERQPSDALQAFLPEQVIDWSSTPETEWSVAEFEPAAFEFEHMADPFLVLKGEEVVSDPLPFEVMLDDLTPSREEEISDSQTFPLTAAETQPEDVVNSLLYADELQIERRPGLSDSDLVSLEQAVDVYESFLEFEEFESVADTPTELEFAPGESHAIDDTEMAVEDVANSLLYADELQIEPQPVLSESDLVTLEHHSDVPAYDFLLGFEEFEPVADTPTELEFAPQESQAIDDTEMAVEDVANSLLYADELQIEPQPVLSDSDLVSLEQAVEVYESVLEFEEIEPVAIQAYLSPKDTAEMPSIDDLLAQFDLGQIPAESSVDNTLQAQTTQTEAIRARKRRRKRKRKAERHQPETVTQEVAYREPENIERGQDTESYIQPDAVILWSEQTLFVAEAPVVDSQTMDEMVLAQPVTAIFEIEPVYGFSEDELEADAFMIPEFELYVAEPEPTFDPDLQAQPGAEWTAFDQVAATAPAVEIPDEAETAENITHEQVQRIPEPPIETSAIPETQPKLEYAPVDNLPALTGFFVGRRWEITQIKHLLGSLRWLTLTGPGGIGKTRLALEIAQELRGEFPDGVCFVSLAAITNPALVQDAVLRALGIKQLKGYPAKDALKQIFEQRNLLLILDHVDAVRNAAPQVMDLLAATCITVVTTCREPLQFAEEVEFPVPPLEFPELKPRKKYRLADLEQADSVAFFIQQTQIVMPGYQPNEQEATLLAQICARLRGIPLALEWVAARSKLYPPQMILIQLDNRLRAVGSDPKTPASPQQVLRSALSWSHSLLNRDEQLLFAGLGLFGGSWTVEAVEAVFRNLISTPIPYALESLVEKRLIREQVLENQRSHFTMDEVVREFALEKLKDHERLLKIREAFAAHYVDLAEYAASALPGAERNLWLKRLESEHDNFRNILNWSLEYHHLDTLVSLTNALWSFWEATGRFTEGHYWLEQSLAQDTNASSQAQTKLRHAAGVMAFQTGDYIKARGLLEECLVIHRFSGDRHAEAQILTLLSDVAAAEGDAHRAADLLTSSLSLGRRMNNTPMVFGSLERLTALATRQSDFNVLRAPLAETLEHFYQNEDLPSLTRSLLFPASLAAGLWQCDRAVQLYAVCSALMDATGLLLPLGESARYDAALSDMRRFMGPEAFESAWETGFAFTVEQAVAYALEYTKSQ